MRRFVKYLVCTIIVLSLLGTARADELPTPNKQLTFVSIGSWGQVDYALQLLKRRNVDINIKQIQMHPEQVQVAIMAKQSDLDIFEFGNEDYLLYAKLGVLANLSTNSKITDAFASWAPEIIDLLRIDDGVFAMPLLILSPAYVLDGPIYRASKFDWPKDHRISWPELVGLADHAALGPQFGKPALFSDNINFPWPLWQYIGLEASKSDRIDFDTDTFRETMEAYKRLVNSGAVVDSEVQDGDNPEPTVAGLMSWDISQNDDAERRMLFTLNGEIAEIAWPHVISVNASSDQYNLAMEFMECLATPEAQKATRFGIDGFFLKDVNEYKGAISDEDIQYREALLKSWVLRRSFPEFHLYCATGVFADYYEDKLSVDELIGMLQKKLDMILME